MTGNNVFEIASLQILRSAFFDGTLTETIEHMAKTPHVSRRIRDRDAL